MLKLARILKIIIYIAFSLFCILYALGALSAENLDLIVSMMLLLEIGTKK